jgi:lipoprotein-anchoring transpeptidase ErfK/SrfK
VTRTRWILTVVPAVVALAVGGTVAAAMARGGNSHPGALATPTATASTTPRPPATSAATSAATSKASKPAAATTSTKPATATGAPVHVSLLESDGQTYGVGMPIVARFTRTVTDAKAFEQAATVLVNGVPAAGAWYWETSGASGYAVEAHYRLADYWPAHASIKVNLPIAGRSAGTGLVYDDSLTLSIATGAEHVTTVDASTKRMTVTSDGKPVKTLDVSLGKASTPTYQGTKIVMEFDRVQDMEGTPVPWSVRLTNSGEFIHAAPWNSQIGQANLSHGCTNLDTADAEWFYKFSLLGDVVQYPDAPGPTAKVWDGLGDWNVSWATWRAGGLLAGSGN